MTSNKYVVLRTSFKYYEKGELPTVKKEHFTEEIVYKCSN